MSLSVYEIKIVDAIEQPDPGKLTVAAGKIINQLINIDKRLLNDLDDSLKPSWVSADSTFAVKIMLDDNIDEAYQKDIISHLCQCNVNILRTIATFSGANDFDQLIKKLTKATNNVSEKHRNSLIPPHINELALAKNIANISKISSLRLHKPSFIYQDAAEEVILKCNEILDKNDLMGAKPQSPDTHEAKFGIIFSPTAGTGDFSLALDGRKIKNVIEDNDFIMKWKAGEKPIYCHDELRAKFTLVRKSDPNDNIYHLKEITEIIHAKKTMTQENLDFDK